MSDAPLERILRETGPNVLEILSEKLSPTDLQSLLLEVYRRRAVRLTPAKLLEQHGNNRFVRPSSADPRTLLEFDRLAFSLATPDFEPIELAPLSPLGTTAAMTTVSQNNLVSTVRNTEAMADPTNVLALECALRRKRAPETVRLCASQRVTRAQPATMPKSWAHFRLFALVSAGRDEGSYRFESQELVRHIAFYLRLFAALKIETVRVALTNFDGALREEVHAAMRGELSRRFPSVKIAEYPERETGRGYYDGSCFQIYATGPDGEEYFLVDGGITDWTQKLLSNKKERFMISGGGTERLCSIFPIM